MELYIPPPLHYLPRLPPVRPPLPTVPVVPAPELPETLTAPEGSYHLAKNYFPDVEQPGPLPSELRPMTVPIGGATFMGGGGFAMAGPTFAPLPPLTSANIFAVSSGSTLVNGQWQPGHPTRLQFADVWYPSRVPGKESGFGTLVRLGLGKKAAAEAPVAGQLNAAERPPDLYKNDDDYSDDDRSDASSERSAPAPAAMHEAISPHGGVPPPLPQVGAKGKGGFGKSAGSGKKQKQDKSLSSSRGGIITRVSPNPNLGAIMDDKGKNGGERVRWAFWNMGRLFVWAEEGGVTDNLAAVVFQQPPTAHAISQLTVGPERQDIVVGLESGDIVYLDFINDRTERFNVGGKVIKSAVTGIHFDPRGGDRFIASFADNTIAQFYLFAEDPTEAAMAIIAPLPRPWTMQFEQESVSKAEGTQTPPGERAAALAKMLSWKNDEWNVPADQRDKKGEKYPWAGKNPLMVVKLACNTDLTALAFSPDGHWLAIVSKDGLLRLVDREENRVTDVFESYFGALNCVAWTPDSRFVAVGGQDDLVTIYSPRESRLVARAQGHSGFVTGIAFDPTMRSEGRGYRFGSVGEDGKLLLWDFSVAALRKPRGHHHSNSSHYRVAVAAGGGAVHPGSNVSLPLSLSAASSSAAHYHPSPPKSEVALLQPVLARVVEGNLMTSLHMGPKTIATVSRAGSIKFWQRPPRQPRSKRGRAKGEKKAGEHA